jgi:hypothetical protein
MNWRQTLSEEEQRAVYDCEERVCDQVRVTFTIDGRDPAAIEAEQRALELVRMDGVVAKLAMMLDNALTRVEQLEQEYHICPMCGKAHPMVDTPLPMPQSDWTFERVMNDCPYRRRQDG